jgi:hypothetical protein
LIFGSIGAFIDRQPAQLTGPVAYRLPPPRIPLDGRAFLLPPAVLICVRQLSTTLTARPLANEYPS